MANVKVAVRVRPRSKKEEECGATNIVKVNGENGLSITNLKVDGPASAGDKHRERVKHFSFDHCYYSVDRSQPNYASQELIFQDLGTEVLNSSFDGYNACLFAYGQTGSGKTFTMMGNPHELGVIPRICEGLCSRVDDFEEGVTFKIEVSYLEIYNERVRDLLADPEDAKYTLKVREHPKEGPYVQDLSRHFVPDYATVTMLLNKGNTYRTTAATHMHDASSRSHAIFTLHFIQAKLENGMPSEIVSKINLVDLAGSERAKYNYSKDRLKEGANINKSLVTLGNCISALAENSVRLTASNSVERLMSEDGDVPSSSLRTKRSAFIPYRNSILTWLLKDSIGGNAKTIMIATISPSSCNFNESMSTLRYARRAKHIINNAVINEDPNVRLIRELRSEIDRLKQLLNCASLSSSQASLVQDNTISRMLQENELKIDQLTEAWVDKWKDAARIMQECNVGIRRESVGVIVESELPHLIGMDDDLLSTGIILYHLKEGKTKIGRSDAKTEQDIVLWGPAIEKQHAVVCNRFGKVVLSPINGALCAVNGMDTREPSQLTQGAVILFGKTNMFRFNHPTEAAKLREKRASSLYENLQKYRAVSEEVKRRCSLSLECDASLLLDNDGDANSDELRPTSFSALSSDVSPIMMYNPGLELERQQQIETDKLDHTRKQLQELEEKLRQAEDAHEEREKKMEEAYQEHQKMIQEQKDVLARLITKNKEAKMQAEKELEEMRSQLRDEKEQGKRQLEEELKHLRENKTIRAQMTATESPNFPKIVPKQRGQSITQLSLLDIDHKRLIQMELLQRQRQRTAEAALARRMATYDRQQHAAKCHIEQEERRLHEIESIPGFENQLSITENDGDVFVCEKREVDGETAAVICWGRVSPIGGRSDSDSSSCKGSLYCKNSSSAVKERQLIAKDKPTCAKQEEKLISKDQRTIKSDKRISIKEQRTPKPEHRTSVRSAEKRSEKIEAIHKPKGVSPSSKKPVTCASRSSSPTKPQGNAVFSRPTCAKQEEQLISKDQRTIKSDKRISIKEQRTPKPEHRTYVRSAEKRSEKIEGIHKSKGVSPSSKKPVTCASRSPSPTKPQGNAVFSRLYPQQTPKFDFLRSKRCKPCDEYECDRDRVKDQPPELIRTEQSRSDDWPTINLNHNKRGSRPTSPSRQGNTGDIIVFAKSQLPKGNLVRSPVSRSKRPSVFGTAKYPRAQIEHRTRSSSPRCPPKCKPERTSHSVPANSNLNSAKVNPKAPAKPRHRSKSPLKPANAGNDLGKNRPRTKSVDKDFSTRPTKPVKKLKSSKEKASSAPTSPSTRKKWERPSKVPGLANTDILFFARKTGNSEAFFVGLNPASKETDLRTRPRSKTHPLYAGDAACLEDMTPMVKSDKHPLGANDQAEINPSVNVIVHPFERLPAVGCSKSMEDMMNLKTPCTLHSSSESFKMHEDSLEDSVGSDIELDSLDETPLSKCPQAKQCAIPVVYPPSPSIQRVSPSNVIQSSFNGIHEQRTINPILNSVQSKTSSEEYNSSLLLYAIESRKNTIESQPDALSQWSYPITPNKELEYPRENIAKIQAVVEDRITSIDTKNLGKTFTEEPESNDLNVINEDLLQSTKSCLDNEKDVEIISDTFLEKAPIDLYSIDTTIDAAAKFSNKTDDYVIHKLVSVTHCPKINSPINEKPDQQVVDCYLEHHPVVPQEMKDSPIRPPVLHSTEKKTLQDMHLEKDDLTHGTSPFQETEGTVIILTAEIESPNSYTLSEVREIKSRLHASNAETSVMEDDIQMQLTAEIQSPESLRITEKREIKSRPEKIKVVKADTVPGENNQHEEKNSNPENIDTLEANENDISVEKKPTISESNSGQIQSISVFQSSIRDLSVVDDGTFSQSSSDELQEYLPLTNNEPSESKSPKVETNQSVITVLKDNHLYQEIVTPIKRDPKPFQDANRESGIVLSSSDEDWPDSDSSDDSCDSGEYTVRRIDGLPEPLEVLEEETLLPDEFSDECSDGLIEKTKLREFISANDTPISSGDKFLSLGSELRRDMIPDGSDNGVKVSEPEPNFQVKPVSINDNRNNILDFDEDRNATSIVNDLRELTQKLELSLAGKLKRIVKQAPVDSISTNTDDAPNLKEHHTCGFEAEDSIDIQNRVSPPGQLYKTSSDESLDYHSANEDLTLDETAVGDNYLDSFSLPITLKGFNLDVQVQSEPPVKSPKETNINIIDEMVYHLPNLSEEIPSLLVAENDTENINHERISVLETPIQAQTISAVKPDFKDIFDSIVEDKSNEDSVEQAMNQYCEYLAPYEPHNSNPGYIGDNEKITSELQQLQIDVNHMSSMIEKYALPTKDRLSCSAMLPPSNHAGRITFESPRSVSISQLSPIPEEFYTQSNSLLPVLSNLKERDHSNSNQHSGQVKVTLDSGSRSESDEDTEVVSKHIEIPQPMTTKLFQSRACSEDTEDSLFMFEESPKMSVSEKDPDYVQWQPEPMVIKEELRPLLGKEFETTKAKMHLLLKVITGRAGQDSCSESSLAVSTPPKIISPKKAESIEILSSDDVDFMVKELCISMPIHLVSHALEPVISKQAVNLPETPIIWPEMPDPGEPEIDIVYMTSTLNHKIKEIIIPYPESDFSGDTRKAAMSIGDWLKECQIAEPVVHRSLVMLERTAIQWPDWGCETQLPDANSHQQKLENSEAGQCDTSDDEIIQILSDRNYRPVPISSDMNGIKVNVGTNTSARNVPVVNSESKCSVATMTVSHAPQTQHYNDIIGHIYVNMNSKSTQVMPTLELESLNPVQTAGSLVLEDEDTQLQTIEKQLVDRGTSPIKLEEMHHADMFPSPSSPEQQRIVDEIGMCSSDLSNTDDDTKVQKLDVEDQALLQKLQQSKCASWKATKRAKDYAHQLRERNLYAFDESDDESSFGDSEYVYEEESDSTGLNQVCYSDEGLSLNHTITEIVYKEQILNAECAVDLVNKLAHLEGSQKLYRTSNKLKSGNVARPDVANLSVSILPSGLSETSGETIVEEKILTTGKPTTVTLSTNQMPSSTPAQSHVANSKISTDSNGNQISKLQEDVELLPVISHRLPKQTQTMPAFSDTSSFDSDYAEDQDLQALTASNERINRMIQEFPSFEEEDYLDVTEPELLVLIDDDDDVNDCKSNSMPAAYQQPLLAPAATSLLKCNAAGSLFSEGSTDEDTIPDSGKDEDLNALRLRLSPMSPSKADWLMGESDDELIDYHQNGIANEQSVAQNKTCNSCSPLQGVCEQPPNMSMSSGIFSASHLMTNSFVSTSKSDDQDLKDIHDAYKNILQAPDSNSGSRIFEVDISPSSVCTQTDSESVSSQPISIVMHDMSSGTEKDRSWTSPDLESLRDNKEFIYSKIGNTRDRRDMSVELMEAQMMHGIGETDAFLKFLDSDLPVEDWFKQRRVIQEKQCMFLKGFVKKQVVKPIIKDAQLTAKRQHPKTYQPQIPQLSRKVHSVSPRLFNKSASVELSPERPSTLPSISTNKPSPSQYRKFLLNLRQGIVAATSTQEKTALQILLEESQMMRANSRLEIARAEMDLNYHIPQNGIEHRSSEECSVKEKPKSSTRELHPAPAGCTDRRPVDKDNSGRERLSEENEDAIDREIECLRSASAVLNSSLDTVTDDYYQQEDGLNSMSADGFGSKVDDNANRKLHKPVTSNNRTPSEKAKQRVQVLPIALESAEPDTLLVSASSLPKPSQETKNCKSVRTSPPLSVQWMYNRYPYNKYSSNGQKSISKNPLVPGASTKFSTTPAVSTWPAHSSLQDLKSNNNHMPYGNEDISISTNPNHSDRSNQESNPSPESSPKRHQSLFREGNSHGRSEKQSSLANSSVRRRWNRTRSCDHLTPELLPLVETPATTSYSDYTGEQAVSTLLTENFPGRPVAIGPMRDSPPQRMIQVGGFNPRNTQHPKEYGGWRLQGQENGVLLLQKTKENNQIDSFMGITVIKASTKTVYDLIRDPSYLQYFDPNLQDVEVLEDLPNRFKILHLLYATDKCYLQKSRDMCVLFKDVKQLKKYVVAATSVQHRRCPDVDGVVRAKVICCGIGLEPVNTLTGEHCKVIYLSQVDLKGELQPKLTNVIMKKQPLCIENIKKHVELGQL